VQGDDIGNVQLRTRDHRGHRKNMSMRQLAVQAQGVKATDTCSQCPQQVGIGGLL
jgi:hypothetical protein